MKMNTVAILMSVLIRVISDRRDHGTWLTEAGNIAEGIGYRVADKYLGSYTVNTINNMFE